MKINLADGVCKLLLKCCILNILPGSNVVFSTFCSDDAWFVNEMHPVMTASIYLWLFQLSIPIIDYNRLQPYLLISGPVFSFFHLNYLFYVCLHLETRKCVLKIKSVIVACIKLMLLWELLFSESRVQMFPVCVCLWLHHGSHWTATDLIIIKPGLFSSKGLL